MTLVASAPNTKPFMVEVLSDHFANLEQAVVSLAGLDIEEIARALDNPEIMTLVARMRAESDALIRKARVLVLLEAVKAWRSVLDEAFPGDRRRQ